MRYARHIPNGFLIVQIPLIITKQGVYIGEFGLETELRLRPFDRDVRIIRCRLVNPLVQRRQIQRFQSPQQPNRGFGGTRALLSLAANHHS